MTAPSNSALQALLARVEAGTIVNDSYKDVAEFSDLCDGVFPDDVRTLWLSAWKAYRGSLDAAKALHEAVLPGAGAVIEYYGAVCHAKVEPENGDEVWANNNSNPARAWLIAVLRALIAQAPGLR